MCLAVPSLVVTVEGREALVEIAGNRRRVDISLVAGVAPGQYVLVHAGIALQVLDEAEAAETLALIAEAMADD